MIHARFSHLSGAFVLLAVVLLLGASTASQQEIPPASSSYASLQPLLAGGAAKGDDEGLIELFQFRSPDASAWIWVRHHPVTGVPEVWNVFHESYVQPGPGVEIPTEYVHREAPPVLTVQELLLWIVLHYDHVEGIGEMTAVPG